MIQNLDTLTLNAPSSGNVLHRPPDMSDEYFLRDRVDPLEVAYPETVVRQRLVKYSDAQAAEALKRGDIGEAFDFSLDALYRSLPLETAATTEQRIHRTLTLLNRRLGGNITETERLELHMREIDLNGLQLFRSFHAPDKSNDPASKVHASSLLEATYKTQIEKAAKYLFLAQKVHEKITDPKAKQDLRGKMFELLFMTEQRRKLLSDETYEEAVLVTATPFEDSPSVHFSPNHNYDVIAFDEIGKTVKVYQCKNGQSTKEYDNRIQVVEGRAFGKFIDRPEKFISALLTLANNPLEVSERTMVSCRNLLENLFDERDKVANHTGRLAVR